MKYRFVITTYKVVTLEAENVELARKSLFDRVLAETQALNNPDVTFNLNEGIDLKKWQDRQKKSKKHE